MSQIERYDLGARSEAWKNWLKRKLKLAHREQRDVAQEIEDREGGGRKRTATNRFVKGDPPDLRRWFEDKPHRIEILLRGTGTSVPEARSRLDALVAGHNFDTDWHPAFPGVLLEPVEIPTPLLTSTGTQTPEAFAEAWREGSAQETVVLVAPPGARRDLAQRQLEAALDSGVDVPADGRDGAPGHVRLADWSHAEVRLLARKLAACDRLSGREQRQLERFADRLEHAPELVVAGMPPCLIIRQLAAIARTGCPETVVEARAQLTQAAWLRATSGSASLGSFDERLLEHIFAWLAARPRGPEEPGPWTVVRRQTVVEATKVALREQYGVAMGRPITELVQRVVEARRPAERRAAAVELTRTVEADPADALVDSLVAAGIFSRAEHGPRGLLRPDHVLAAIWASRGLTGLPVDGRWERLVDPVWGVVLDELVATGRVGLEEVAATLARAPQHLALDVALWQLRASVAAPDPRFRPDVTGWWADLVWASAHGAYRAVPWERGRSWTGSVLRTLERVSRVFRHELPLLGEQPERTVGEHVSQVAVRIVASWRPLHPANLGALGPRIRSLSRWQDVPESVAGWREARGGGKSRLDRLWERAERGSEAARELLSGEAWCGQHGAIDAGWTRFPAALRVRAAARWAVQQGPMDHRGQILVRELIGDEDSVDDLVTAARRLGWRLSAAQVQRPVGDLDPWVQLAERMGDVEALEAMAQLPGRQLSHVQVRELVGWRSHGTERLVWSRQGVDPTLQVFAHEWDRWEELAHLASVALLRLGSPDWLRSRWRQGPAPLPDWLAMELQRCSALLHLLSLAPAEWPSWWELQDGPSSPGEQVRAFPWETLADAARLSLEEVPAYLSSARAVRSLYDVGVANVDHSIVDAVRGVLSLLLDLELPLPAELDALVECFQQKLHAGEDWRARALEVLCARCDDAPILHWLTSLHPSHARLDPGVIAFARSDAWLDRAWALVEEGALGEKGSDEVREHLLFSGSACDARPAPRPFVVKEALTTRDLSLACVLSEPNGNTKEWIPVWSDLLDRAELGKRGHARAAAALLRLEDQSRTDAAREELAFWVFNRPFAGGAAWHQTEDGWAGGALELLACVVDHLPGDKIEALWRRALELPIDDSGPDMPGCDVPQTCHLPQGTTTTPWPLDVLADALVATGRTQVILDTWRDPPQGEPTSAGQPRGSWLRDRLFRWWLTHASSRGLAERLTGERDDGYDALHEQEVALELLSRGDQDLREVARMLAAQRRSTWLLLRVAPQELPAVMAGQGGCSPAELLDDASIPPWEDPRIALLVREMSLRLSPSDK